MTSITPVATRFSILFVTIVVIILIFGGLSFVATYSIWEGSFAQAEYQVEFRDQTNRPLQGIILRVEDQRGILSYCYPVSDFNASRDLISNKDGVLTFHHVGRGVEFSGNCYFLFFIIPIGKFTPPE